MHEKRKNTSTFKGTSHAKKRDAIHQATRPDSALQTANQARLRQFNPRKSSPDRLKRFDGHDGWPSFARDVNLHNHGRDFPETFRFIDPPSTCQSLGVITLQQCPKSLDVQPIRDIVSLRETNLSSQQPFKMPSRPLRPSYRRVIMAHARPT